MCKRTNKTKNQIKYTNNIKYNNNIIIKNKNIYQEGVVLHCNAVKQIKLTKGRNFALILSKH